MLVVSGRPLSGNSAALSLGERAVTIFSVTLSWSEKMSFSSSVVMLSP